MEVKLDAEAVQTIASAAIFESISQEDRSNILKQAIEQLLTPEKHRPGYYGVEKTPLQKAFDAAISQAAYKAVSEKIENDPEVKAQIQSMIGPLLQAALQTEAEHYESSLANHLGNALGLWLNEQARKDR